MATSEGIPSSIDIEFLELNDNPYLAAMSLSSNGLKKETPFLIKIKTRCKSAGYNNFLWSIGESNS